MMPRSSIDNNHKHLRRQHIASISLLFALIVAFNFILFDENDYSYSYQSTTNGSRRQLATTETEGSDEQQPSNGNSTHRHRKLLGSDNGPNPPPEDIADDTYIVKPAIGVSFTKIFETMDQTLLSPPETGVTASSFENWVKNDGLPKSAVPYEYDVSDNGKQSSVIGSSQYDSWKTKPIQSYPEWLEVDLGLPEEVAKFQIEFSKASQAGLSFELQCKQSSEAEYTTLETYTDYTATSLVYESSIMCRYMRLYFTAGYTAISKTRCHDLDSFPFRAESGFNAPMGAWNLGFNTNVISANGEDIGIIAPRFVDGCSKIQPGECAWFHTGTYDTSTWFLHEGFTSPAYSNDFFDSSSGGGLVPDYDWTDYKGFAYHVCRSATSSSNCATMGDLTMSKVCVNHSDEDDLVFRHRYPVGNGIWPMIYEGTILDEITPLGSPTPDEQFIAVKSVTAWRMPRVASTQTTSTNCGSTYEGVKNTLLSSNSHGSVITSWDQAEFFQMSATPAQAEAFAQDPCCFAIEPNYKIYARGSMTKGLRTSPKENQEQGPQAPDGSGRILKGQEKADETHRRLGIPEFNLKENSPANWGLERIATRGARNGKYVWVSEGFGTDIYIFDTGIHNSNEFDDGRYVPDQMEYYMEKNGRKDTSLTQRKLFDNGYGSESSRMNATQVCAGEEFDEGEHGTFIASIAAGKRYGVGKSARIHPMQILDINGEGSLASFLCAVDKLIQDGIDYYAAYAPDKIKGVVNLSIGTNGKSDILDKAAEDFVAAGYTVVIAAGDFGGNACHYSPTTPGAIRVGALKDKGLGAGGDNDKTATSNYGECIDIWAPGEDIQGLGIEDYEEITMSGTSVAAAFVTGTLSMFMEEINSHDFPQTEFSIHAKENMLRRSERDVLGDLGAYSPNRMLQTSSSPCQINAHCEAPKVCMYDGACGVISDYFN